MNRGGGNGDGIDLADQVFGVAEGGDVILSGELLRLCDIDIGDADKLALGKLAIDLGVNAAHFAGADNRCSNFLHVFHYTRSLATMTA